MSPWSICNQATCADFHFAVACAISLVLLLQGHHIVLTIGVYSHSRALTLFPICDKSSIRMAFRLPRLLTLGSA